MRTEAALQTRLPFERFWARNADTPPNCKARAEMFRVTAEAIQTKSPHAPLPRRPTSCSVYNNLSGARSAVLSARVSRSEWRRKLHTLCRRNRDERLFAVTITAVATVGIAATAWFQAGQGAGANTPGSAGAGAAGTAGIAGAPGVAGIVGVRDYEKQSERRVDPSRNR